MVGSSKLLTALPTSYQAVTTAAEKMEHFLRSDLYSSSVRWVARSEGSSVTDGTR